MWEKKLNKKQKILYFMCTCVRAYETERVTTVPFPFCAALGAEVYQLLDDRKNLASLLWSKKLLQCCQLEVYKLYRQ